jgi:PIN domain nuclease of toxin-antitoxin system
VARNLIENQAKRFLSVASLWEMSIKVSMGKLELGMTKDGAFGSYPVTLLW